MEGKNNSYRATEKSIELVREYQNIPKQLGIQLVAAIPLCVHVKCRVVTRLPCRKIVPLWLYVHVKCRGTDKEDSTQIKCRGTDKLGNRHYSCMYM